jgi:hypothetical protein
MNEYVTKFQHPDFDVNSVSNTQEKNLIQKQPHPTYIHPTPTNASLVFCAYNNTQ